MTVSSWCNAVVKSCLHYRGALWAQSWQSNVSLCSITLRTTVIIKKDILIIKCHYLQKCHTWIVFFCTLLWPICKLSDTVRLNYRTARFFTLNNCLVFVSSLCSYHVRVGQSTQCVWGSPHTQSWACTDEAEVTLMKTTVCVKHAWQQRAFSEHPSTMQRQPTFFGGSVF